MAEVGLLEWADKQHDWIRDALRRHAGQPGFVLDEENKSAVAARVRHVGGFVSDEPPTCSPLATEHLKASSSNEPRAVLCSLGPVKHLNRLAEEQQLRFATDGVTVIYGDNGSGKSGYCRIAKKLCRSLTADDLLGNVFELGVKPPAEVLVRFLEEGATEPTPVTWKDGTHPPALIARISVFDSANARLYVDKHNRIGFLPAAIALLERHGLIRGELEAGFREEIKTIEKKLKTPLPGGYTVASAVAKLLARLEIKSKEALPSTDEFRKLAAVSERETAELAGLEQALASDPSTMAAKRRRAKAALQKFLTTFEQIDEALSVAAVELYRDLYATADSTAQAAKFAASGAFATMPLSGVGLSPWRLMFDHARAYSIKKLEPLYSFVRTVPLEDVGAVMARTQARLEMADSAGIPENDKAAIKGYNRDDCASTQALRNWLETVRADLIAAGAVIDRPVAASAEISTDLDDWQRKVAALVARLTEGVPDDVGERAAEQQARWLLAFMLDWHGRENKAVWWEYFRLRDLSAEDLLHERAGLADLTFLEQAGGTTKAPVHRYRFALQDTDIRAEDDLNSIGGDKFGSVVAISLDDRTIDIKKRGDTAGLHPEAIFAHNFVKTQVLADSLMRIGEYVADHGMEGAGDHRAARDLLMAVAPRLRWQELQVDGDGRGY